MKTFLTLLKREFNLFWNNKVLRILFIGAPILYGILIGYVYEKGKATDLPIIVVDLDQTDMSYKAIQMLQENEVVDVISVLSDIHAANEETINYEAASTIVIPKNFEKDILLKKYPEILVYVNTANMLTANFSSSAIQLSLGTLKAGISIESLKKQGMPEAVALTQYEPFKMSFIRKHNRSTNYLYFLWPGVLATILQQVLLLGLALSFASEFEKGSFSQLIEKTNSTAKLLLVKIIPYLIMSLGIWGLYLLFSVWFRVPLSESIWALTAVAFIFVLSVSFMGILVSILIPNQLKATEILMVVATPSFIISGFTWPLSQMPVWIQFIANGIPLTHFLKIFRVLVVEQGTLTQTSDSLYAMIYIMLICGIVSYIALHIKKKRIKPN
ncbi:ABC transporter permease [Imtechella halotolerans]|uniref:Transport permease protein n=1 Tax=Imtechella halotolerans K1 TaxID=946077 RepID=I0WKL2_9FLAO|nr:ABC transporter permease [Imtechella halotolerans]EID76928.1 ABC transporter permease [Imtechella halotolerans K1]WMQ62512.1 ABC transporter permease [Imtechella halotolerans]